MRKILLAMMAIAVMFVSVDAKEYSFREAKKIVYKKIYIDHRQTIYCQNPYEHRRVDGREKAMIVQDAKYYSPRKPFYKNGKPNTRAERVEIEHIMPAWVFGHQLQCWQDGGRENCTKTSEAFRRMEGDLYNLAPAIGEVNGDRSNYRFMDAGNTDLRGQYGECRFRVDFKERRAYPADYAKGEIARAYLYMADRYGLKLSSRERQMMEAWHRAFPVSDWELVRAARIEKYQGNKNPYIR